MLIFGSISFLTNHQKCLSFVFILPELFTSRSKAREIGFPVQRLQPLTSVAGFVPTLLFPLREHVKRDVMACMVGRKG